ncbi:hypothetical protein ACJIZ3_013646 [Penstemon smallii]|uniref:Knottins-like domain-containing protein n=1 Tax=Penstemon smallii TaxID=265156 RepID=A0ABD3RHP6_9LAMI
MGHFSTVFLVLLLLLVTEIGPMVVHATCPSLSKNFKGWCWFNDSCRTVCEDEWATGGYCRFFQCICTHRCAF